MFRFASEVQGTRRLGLTATFIREDGKEEMFFSLIGPKLYDVLWKVDLPSANVAIQVFGNFGSRQEEAQRIGRILRPVHDKQAFSYTIVTRDTVEQTFAEKRQLFLIEQGYQYKIVDAHALYLLQVESIQLLSYRTLH